MFQRQVGGHGDRLCRRTDKELAEATLHMRHPHCAAVEAHIQAVVRLAFLAEAALSTSPAWIDDNALADTQVRNPGSGFEHLAGHLVAQDHGLLHSHRAEAAMQVIVQIGAADASRPDANHHLARTDSRALDLVNA